jgi:hypothetical protein
MMMTEKEIEDYLASDEFFRLTTSTEFHERGVELDRRLANEPLTVEQSAEIMKLPVDVFSHLWGGHLAWEAVKKKMGTPH